MKLTKGLRALIESEGGSVCVIVRPGRSVLSGKPCLHYEASLLNCDTDAVVGSDSEEHPKLGDAIRDLDAVVARMARVFTGAS